MNLRCAFCQTPYTLSRKDKLIALQHMEAEKLIHYDTHCPRCRKATRVQRKMLEATFPNWREALHELETQVEAVADAPASAPKPEAVADTLQGTPVAQAESKPAHKPRSHAKAKPEAPKPAAKTSSPKGKAATKKSK